MKEILIAALEACGLKYVVEGIVDRTNFEIAPALGSEAWLQIRDEIAKFTRA